MGAENELIVVTRTERTGIHVVAGDEAENLLRNVSRRAWRVEADIHLEEIIGIDPQRVLVARQADIEPPKQVGMRRKAVNSVHSAIRVTFLLPTQMTLPNRRSFKVF